ncbi:zinc finger C2HC domain-containing protein 1A isoform X1 [Poeciliopsis prolifica]|uniref:zinc finger C2HC domain-containing protein 1A isoform X1 n=1 Tax=Poeciliopsis prolifica TaxID=188132 RepID=UPI00241364AF|nr:zinc finger C2HC domain-containing protein 1A isoform X1 [Poeciliopsis prolifica]
MEEFQDGEAPGGDLSQCKICKRCFFPSVLEKHARICQKAAAKRRRVFDSSRQRAEGTDICVLKPMKAVSQTSAAAHKAEPPKKPSNWRKKHEDFIATIRAAKAATQAMRVGAPLPPPPPPTYDPDYIQCPYCQRRFNENAADRHINFCREQAARMPNKSKLVDAKKTPLRTQFKPPGPVKKTTPPGTSALPSTSSRVPQRPLGQYSVSPSAGPVRKNISGIPSPPSGVGNKARGVSSGYGGVGGGVRNSQVGIGANKKKADTNMSGNDVNGGVKSKFCHACGAKYPVDSANFCCECGIRRMCI